MLFWIYYLSIEVDLFWHDWSDMRIDMDDSWMQMICILPYTVKEIFWVVLVWSSISVKSERLDVLKLI